MRDFLSRPKLKTFIGNNFLIVLPLYFLAPSKFCYILFAISFVCTELDLQISVKCFISLIVGETQFDTRIQISFAML